MTLEELARAKGFTPEQLETFFVRDDLLGERVEIPYLDRNGDEYSRLRLRYDDRAFGWSAGTEGIHLYGEWRSEEWGENLVICEGESDCWALWLNHIPAIGVPGASNIGLLHGKQFNRQKVLGIVQEPGDAGARFAFDGAQQLYATGFKGEVAALRFTPYKDPREAYLDNPEMVAHLFDSVVWKERSRIARAAPKYGPRIYTVAELRAMPPEAHHWRVEGVVHDEGVVFVVAQPKVGKSTLLRTMALAIARGEPFLDRATVQTNVMWLAFEEPKPHVMECFDRLGLRNDDPLGFHFGDPPERTLAWLNEVAEDYGAIVIDTLGKFLPAIQNLNDYAEFNRHFRPLERFAHETHRTLLIAHHAPWVGPARPQGTSAIAGAADAILTLTPYSANRLTLSSMQRGGRPFDHEIVLLDRETERVSLGANVHTQAVESMEDRLRALFANGEELTREQILRLLSGNAAVKNESFQRMAQTGDLVVVGGRGVKGDPLRYLPKERAQDRPHIVIPFPVPNVGTGAEPERTGRTNKEPERNQNGTASSFIEVVTVVGAVKEDNLLACAVCKQVRAAYTLADKRAWCTVCYDRGLRPAPIAT